MLARKQPYFSIIIPTYNRADIILETINSVLSQRFANFELIIVDDGGTDDTEKVIEAIDDRRVYYFKKENAERGAARNFGANKSKGVYLNFLDSDDLLYPNHLECAFEFIEKKDPSVFFQHYNLILNNRVQTVPVPKGKVINDLLVRKGNFLSCDGSFIKRSIFMKHPFSECREMSASEDFELWLRLAARFPIFYLPNVTSSIRLHEERSVLNINIKDLIQRKELMLASIFADETFMNHYGSFKSSLIADAYFYISLHLILSDNKKSGLNYLLKGVYKRPNLIFSKRFWAIIKHLIF